MGNKEVREGHRGGEKAGGKGMRKGEEKLAGDRENTMGKGRKKRTQSITEEEFEEFAIKKGKKEDYMTQGRERDREMRGKGRSKRQRRRQRAIERKKLRKEEEGEEGKETSESSSNTEEEDSSKNEEVEGGRDEQTMETETEKAAHASTCEQESTGFQTVTWKRQSKAFEKAVIVQGVIVNWQQATKDIKKRIMEQEGRFYKNQDKYIVTARLKQEYVTQNKKVNSVKIMAQVDKDEINVDSILENSFTALDLEFKDKEVANKCLSIEDNSNRRINYTIAKRNIQVKGVITLWDGEIQELYDAIMEKDKIVSLERLRKRIYNGREKRYEWESTKHIIIIWRDNKLPEEIKLFQGRISINVRPFVEYVIQCYQCYGYGHWKEKCKKDRKCIVCGGEYHGYCEREKKCVNCGEGHKANDKECKIYKKHEEMNKIKAAEGMTQHEARQAMYVRQGRRSSDEEEEEKRQIGNAEGLQGGIRREVEKVRKEERMNRGAIPRELQIQENTGRKWSSVVRGIKERRVEEGEASGIRRYGLEEEEEKRRRTKEIASEQQKKMMEEKDLEWKKIINQTKEDLKKQTRGMIVELEEWWEEKIEEMTEKIEQHTQKMVEERIQRQEEKWNEKIERIEERMRKIEERINKEEEEANRKATVMGERRLKGRKKEKAKEEKEEKTNDMEVELDNEKNRKKNNRKE